MRIHLSSLGCRLNEAELEQWAAAFSAAGDQLVNDAATADIQVLNTCAVTQAAVRKSRQKLQRLQRANPAAKLVVSGCYSALESTAVLAAQGIDLVVPNSEKDTLVKQTRRAFAIPVMPEAATRPAESALFRRHRHRAFIKIQDGCRYRCTFCIVTVARGAERSRPVQELVSEVNRLYREGVLEIVLTGVHVGGYGSDLGSSLKALVEALLADTDMPRIRFASVEPWDLPDGFLALFDNPRLQPHMHLPLQSGCDTVLRRMARRCKRADFHHLVQQLRTAVPGFNVTTDIIVGFPGETDAEWRESLETIESIGFGHVHIFSYSPREGTRAATLPDPVAPSIQRQRSQQLHRLAERMRQAVCLAQVGRTADVLWEYARVDDAGFQHSGYTPNYVKVTTCSDVDLANQITATRLTRAEDSTLAGIPVGALT